MAPSREKHRLTIALPAAGTLTASARVEGVGRGRPPGQTLPPLVTLPDLTPPEIAVGLETITLQLQSADTYELAGRTPRKAMTRGY